ncbi:MAG: VWA domain-containing protein [Lachnospiraceae bacterium]|nr:VWA domain-containing protein [Lachnospiraceae bacterium]
MKKNLTEIVFILDRSGSMRGLEADTIGGFNSMIEKQRKEDGEAMVSTILFDDTTEVVYDRVDISKIEPMNDKQYYVRGCTALLDAIGLAIHHMGNVHKKLGKDSPEKTIFIITTDGMENASKKYNYSKIKNMVERQKEKYGWEFLFLGANIDAIKEAGRFGISASRAVEYKCDSAGTQLNYKVLSETVSKMRSAKGCVAMSEILDSEDCFAQIRTDRAMRG